MSVFDASSGSLCLDLANTWGDRSDAANDTLGEYRDLLVWARDAGVVDAEGCHRLAALLERKRAESIKVFNSAVVLRESVYRMGSAVAAGKIPDPAALRKHPS